MICMRECLIDKVSANTQICQYYFHNKVGDKQAFVWEWNGFINM